MAAPFIDIMRTVFPVVALHPEQAGQIARPDFFGTAFCIAPGVFMTAAHVVTEAAAAGDVGIAGPTSAGPFGGAKATLTELFPERDIALIFCDVKDVTALGTWLVKRAQVLMDVSSFGYPHAVTWSPAGDQLNVVFRAYKGHVITTRGFERLPGAPAVYEVSCPFPQGLSGAPVVVTVGDDLAVAGVVIGTDTVNYGGVPQIVGIAMIGDEIFDRNSETLGGAIGKALDFNAAALDYSGKG